MNTPYRKRSYIIAVLSMFFFSFLINNYPVNATGVACDIPDPKDPKICLDSFYAGNNVSFYNPNAKACSTTGTVVSASGPLVGNDNPEKIFNYFIGKGLTAAQAAGFLGNIQKESTFNPNALQPGQVMPDNAMPIDGRGFGLIQWTYTSRQAPLVQLAKETNRDTTDLALQLDYVWKELTDTALNKGQHWESTLANLKATDNPVDAARSIHYDYERSSAWPGFDAIRGTHAQMWFDKFKGNAATATPAATDECTGATGGLGDYTSDEFKLFNQCDPPWGQMQVPSPDGTACQVACGPTSVAMMVVNMTGQNITPTDTINYVSQNNMWYGTGGTTMQTTVSTAKNWGLQAELVAANVTLNDITAILDKGGLVMMSGLGATPFLPGVRHFVIIRGIAADGKFIIADPNGKSGNYDTGTILAGIRAAGLGGTAVYK